MIANPKEELHRLVDALPDGEVPTVQRILEALIQPAVMSGTAFFEAQSRSIEPASDQEVDPIMDIDELRGDFWPEDEGPDEFVEAVREWRREGGRA